jgi:hypothetical protein
MIEPSMSRDELNTSPAFQKLSPIVQKILLACFYETNCDIVQAVKKVEPIEHDLAINEARLILANLDVRAVIDLYVFGLDSFSLRDTPFAPIDISL